MGAAGGVGRAVGAAVYLERNEMTSEKKVKLRRPAKRIYAIRNVNKMWEIRATAQDDLLGWGTTESRAWADAWRNIQAQRKEA